MDKIKTVLKWIWENTKSVVSFLYSEFTTYPQYGWPVLAFVTGYLVGKFV